MGIAAAILALCLLIIGTFSLQNQDPALAVREEKFNTEVEKEAQIPEKNPAEEEKLEEEESKPTITPDTELEKTPAPAPKNPVNKSSGLPAPSSISWANMALQIEANQAVLNWSTFSESNTAYFEIERSIDQKSFNRIGKVSGAGVGDFLDQEYSFVDPGLMMIGFPRIYYRIKQIGLDKRVSQSQIYEHSIPLNLGLYIKVDTIEDGIITLAYVADEACEALFQVMTKEGKVLYEEKIDVGFNARRRKLDASIWGEGDYLMVLSTDETRVSEWLQVRDDEKAEVEE